MKSIIPISLCLLISLFAISNLLAQPEPEISFGAEAPVAVQQNDTTNAAGEPAGSILVMNKGIFARLLNVAKFGVTRPELGTGTKEDYLEQDIRTFLDDEIRLYMYLTKRTYLSDLSGGLEHGSDASPVFHEPSILEPNAFMLLMEAPDDAEQALFDAQFQGNTDAIALEKGGSDINPELLKLAFLKTPERLETIKRDAARAAVDSLFSNIPAKVNTELSSIKKTDTLHANNIETGIKAVYHDIGTFFTETEDFSLSKPSVEWAFKATYQQTGHPAEDEYYQREMLSVKKLLATNISEQPDPAKTLKQIGKYLDPPFSIDKHITRYKEAIKEQKVASRKFKKLAKKEQLSLPEGFISGYKEARLKQAEQRNDLLSGLAGISRKIDYPPSTYYDVEKLVHNMSEMVLEGIGAKIYYMELEQDTALINEIFAEAKQLKKDSIAFLQETIVKYFPIHDPSSLRKRIPEDPDELDKILAYQFRHIKSFPTQESAKYEFEMVVDDLNNFHASLMKRIDDVLPEYEKGKHLLTSDELESAEGILYGSLSPFSFLKERLEAAAGLINDAETDIQKQLIELTLAFDEADNALQEFIWDFGLGAEPAEPLRKSSLNRVRQLEKAYIGLREAYRIRLNDILD